MVDLSSLLCKRLKKRLSLILGRFLLTSIWKIWGVTIENWTEIMILTMKLFLDNEDVEDLSST